MWMPISLFSYKISIELRRNTPSTALHNRENHDPQSCSLISLTNITLAYIMKNNNARNHAIT